MFRDAILAVLLLSMIFNVNPIAAIPQYGICPAWNSIRLFTKLSSGGIYDIGLMDCAGLGHALIEFVSGQ